MIQIVMQCIVRNIRYLGTTAQHISEWALVVIVYAQIFIIVDSKLFCQLPEFLVGLFWHVVFVPLPGQDNAPIVF